MSVGVESVRWVTETGDRQKKTVYSLDLSSEDSREGETRLEDTNTVTDE